MFLKLKLTAPATHEQAFHAVPPPLLLLRKGIWKLRFDTIKLSLVFHIKDYVRLQIFFFFFKYSIRLLLVPLRTYYHRW